MFAGTVSLFESLVFHSYENSNLAELKDGEPYLLEAMRDDNFIPVYSLEKNDRLPENYEFHDVSSEAFWGLSQIFSAIVIWSVFFELTRWTILYVADIHGSESIPFKIWYAIVRISSSGKAASIVMLKHLKSAIVAYFDVLLRCLRLCYKHILTSVGRYAG